MECCAYFRKVIELYRIWQSTTVTENIQNSLHGNGARYNPSTQVWASIQIERSSKLSSYKQLCDVQASIAKHEWSQIKQPNTAKYDLKTHQTQNVTKDSQATDMKTGYKDATKKKFYHI